MSAQIHETRTKAFPFRFQNFWCKYQNVDAIVSRNWKNYQGGTNMVKIMRKLKFVKYDVKTALKSTLVTSMINSLKMAIKLIM